LQSVTQYFCNTAAMSYDLLLALLGFAFVTSVTPGPNNMMLLASGVNFGLRRTLPHMLGISLGHSLMVFLVGMGLAGVIHSAPQALIALKIASVAYMLWLAWKIAHAAAPEPGRVGGRPFNFLQAAAFQWVNPKAWAMALGAISAYAPSGDWRGVALVALVFASVNLPSVSLWAAMGEGLRGWMANPKRLRLFNWTMAALLVASLLPVLRL
jgi:threonine/homoserine/homoserine lactone efflux protein